MSIEEDKRNQSRLRKNRIVFRVDDSELTFIQAKMKILNIKNREAYMRKMAIDGQCIRYDYSGFEAEIRKNNYLMSNAAKNINLIAKRVNSTGNFYSDDLKSLQKQVDFLMERQVKIMELFMKETKEN